MIWWTLAGFLYNLCGMFVSLTYDQNWIGRQITSRLFWPYFLMLILIDAYKTVKLEIKEEQKLYDEEMARCVKTIYKNMG